MGNRYWLIMMIRFQALDALFPTSPFSFLLEALTAITIQTGHKAWLPFSRLTLILSRYFSAVLTFLTDSNETAPGHRAHSSSLPCPMQKYPLCPMLRWVQGIHSTSLTPHSSHSRGAISMDMRSNFGALIQTEVKASKFNSLAHI